MTVLLVVAVVLLVTMFISGLVVLAISHSRRMERFWSEHRQNWTNIARELGLTYDPNAGVGSYGMIEGVYHGVWVRIDVYTSGGDNSHTTTRVRSYHHPQLNLKLNIRRETSLGTLGRALGLRDIETGDAAFDQAFHVEGNDPDAV
ncbi:MAG: hypothetical protein CMH57_04955, partial [Myxococcales bacterium]|nr:hypothetical protein [Myxococcales bacterium]